AADAKVALGIGLSAALELGRLDELEGLLARIDAMSPGERAPSLQAQAARYRAGMAAARGEHGSVEQGFKTAEAIFREHGLTFPLAQTELEHGEWLVGQGRIDEAEPLLTEAREIFERLEAAPWLERLGGPAGPAAAGAARTAGQRTLPGRSSVSSAVPHSLWPAPPAEQRSRVRRSSAVSAARRWARRALSRRLRPPNAGSSRCSSPISSASPPLP